GFTRQSSGSRIEDTQHTSVAAATNAADAGGHISEVVEGCERKRIIFIWRLQINRIVQQRRPLRGPVRQAEQRADGPGPQFGLADSQRGDLRVSAEQTETICARSARG